MVLTRICSLRFRAAAYRATIARAKGMTQVAKAAGLSRESRYRAPRKDVNPSFETVLKVAHALGIRFGAQAA